MAWMKVEFEFHPDNENSKYISWEDDPYGIHNWLDGASSNAILSEWAEKE